MEYNFNVRDKLVIELLSSDVLEGEYVSGSKDRIDLINIVEYTSRNSLGDSLLTFYRSEISSIHRLGINAKETDVVEIKSAEDEVKTIKLPKCEYERLKDLLDTVIYMATMDKRYFDAVQHIAECENIGVVALGSSLGRASKLDLLVISTWNQLYIFDLHLYNEKHFPQDLLFILQSGDVKKILHDSRSLVDCFHHTYKYRIDNIFDTQVADMMIRKKNGEDVTRYKNLGECLNSYFNFPLNLLDTAMNLPLKVWSERPLTAGRKVHAAQLAVYLIVLKNHLETILLKDFYDEVGRYSTSSLKCSVVETQNLLQSLKIGTAPEKHKKS